MQLLGTYNIENAREDIFKERRYGVIRFPGNARYANVTYSLTE